MRNRALMLSPLSTPVIPAQAGTQLNRNQVGSPAFAEDDGRGERMIESINYKITVTVHSIIDMNA
jgi:hypothetical protein